jgi:hypothetical protein
MNANGSSVAMPSAMMSVMGRANRSGAAVMTAPWA